MPTVEEVKSSDAPEEVKVKEPMAPKLNMKAIAQISFVKTLVQECVGEGETTLTCSPRESLVASVGKLNYTFYTATKGESTRYLMHFVFKDENDTVVCDQRVNHDDLCTHYPVPFCFDGDFIDKFLSINAQFRETDSAIIVVFGTVKFTLAKLNGEKNVLRMAKA